jgi:hypothetical protein
VFLIFISFVLLNGCSNFKIENNQKKEEPQARVPIIDDLEEDLNERFKVSNKPNPLPVKKEVLVQEKKVASQKVATKKVNKKLPLKPVVVEKIEELIPEQKETLEVQEVHKKNWDFFDDTFLRVGEKSIITATYLGVSAAKLTIEIKDYSFIDGRKNFYFYARAKSADFYRWIYELDDVVESYVDKESFLPVKFSLSQRETKKDVDHIELFDREENKVYFRYKKVKKGKEYLIKKNENIPHWGHDLMSSYFFIRGLHFDKEKSFIFPMTAKAKTSLLKVELVSQERIKLDELGEFPALKINVTTKYDGELAKRGVMTLWISNDKYRRFLRIESELKIGKVVGELTDYQINGKPVL